MDHSASLDGCRTAWKQRYASARVFQSEDYEKVTGIKRALDQTRRRIFEHLREHFPEQTRSVCIDILTNDGVDSTKVNYLFVSIEHREDGRHLYLRGRHRKKDDSLRAYELGEIKLIMQSAIENPDSPWTGPLLIPHEKRILERIGQAQRRADTTLSSLVRKRDWLIDDMVGRLHLKTISKARNVWLSERHRLGLDRRDITLAECEMVAIQGLLSIINEFDIHYGGRMMFNAVEQAMDRVLREFINRSIYDVHVPDSAIYSDDAQLPSHGRIVIVEEYDDQITAQASIGVAGAIGDGIEVCSVASDLEERVMAKNLAYLERIARRTRRKECGDIDEALMRIMKCVGAEE